MAYFKIGANDYSAFVAAEGLTVSTEHNFSAQTNAAGNTVVDYQNSKRTIKVDIIPLTDNTMQAILNDIQNLAVSISFRNPATGNIELNVQCICPQNEVQYYTIQAGKALFNAFSLTFEEL